MFPTLFEFGPISVASRWFFACLGFIAASYLFSKSAKKKRLRLDFILSHSLFIFGGTLFFARLGFVALHFSLYSEYHPGFVSAIISFFKIWDQGLSFWGALGGFLFLFWYIAKKEGEPLNKWLDLMVPAILTGFLFGAVGNFLDGSSHGRETSLPWGVTFDSAVVKYAVPVHPTQLYAFLYILLMLIGLHIGARRFKPLYEGQIFEITIAGLSFLRFGEEFLRGDDASLLFNFVRLPQAVALGVLIFMTAHFWRHHQNFILKLKSIIFPT